MFRQCGIFCFFILLKQFRAQFDLQSISWLNIQMYWCNIWRSYHCWMILILTQLVFRHILCVRVLVNDVLKYEKNTVEFPNPNHNGSGRFVAVKSDSTHHFFGNAWTKPGPLRFSQFSGCWLILSVYWVLPFPLEDCSVFGNFVITHIFKKKNFCIIVFLLLLMLLCMRVLIKFLVLRFLKFCICVWKFIASPCCSSVYFSVLYCIVFLFFLFVFTLCLVSNVVCVSGFSINGYSIVYSSSNIHSNAIIM